MRRTIFVALGILEILAAGVLFTFVWLLPGPDYVHERVGRIERVSRQTSIQVRKLRNEVRRLRQGQPHVDRMAHDLQARLQELSDQLQRQPVDYSRLRGIHGSLGASAAALDELSDRPPPDGIAVAAEALGSVGSFFKAVGADDVARVLQAGRRELGRTRERWPEIQNGLRGSAALLRDTQANLKYLLDNRPGYEDSLHRSQSVLEGLSAAVPMYTTQLGKDMEDQERSLSALAANIDEVTAVIPEVKVASARFVVFLRILLGVVGAIFSLHGGYLAVSTWLSRNLNGQ
jgi:hypothetical protein